MVRRSIFDDAGALVGFSHGTVRGWLDAHESDFSDERGAPAALYRVVFEDGPLEGDEEDLEMHELLQSLEDDPAAAPAAPAKRKRKRAEPARASKRRAPARIVLREDDCEVHAGDDGIPDARAEATWIDGIPVWSRTCHDLMC